MGCGRVTRNLPPTLLKTKIYSACIALTSETASGQGAPPVSRGPRPVKAVARSVAKPALTGAPGPRNTISKSGLSTTFVLNPDKSGMACFAT